MTQPSCTTTGHHTVGPCSDFQLEPELNVTAEENTAKQNVHQYEDAEFTEVRR